MHFETKTTTLFTGREDWLGSADGTQATEPGTLDVAAFTPATHYPNGAFLSGLPLTRLADGRYGPFNAEVQSLIATGATAGTFTLTFDGETTAAIAYNATAATVQAALEGLSNIDPGDVTVAGGPLPNTAVNVTFNRGGNVPQMTTGGTLTGGTATVTTTTASTGRLAGFLYGIHDAPSDTALPVAVAVLRRGKVVLSRLPVPVTEDQLPPLFQARG